MMIEISQPLALLDEAAAAQGGLNLGGAVLMVTSIAVVLGLTIFCLVHILREQKPEEHHHVPLEIETPDTREGRGQEEDEPGERDRRERTP